MMKKKPNPYLSTYAAAESVGVSVSQFVRLTDKLGVVHDDTYVNPHYRSGPPAKLWSKRKIAAFKRRKEVKEFIVGAAQRSASALAGTVTKSTNLVEECESWTPQVQTYTRDKYESLIGAALRSYNDFGAMLRHQREPASRSSSPEFLLRVTRNFIRHLLTDYDQRLADIRGRCGTNEAYATILRPIVETAIDAAYPDLESYIRQMAAPVPRRSA